MGENYFETARDINDLVLGHRIRSDYGDLRALTESIRLIGFVQPITITPTGAVVSGGRRLQAARALGLRTVDVWVRTDITSELELLLAEQQENENRKPYTRIEQARFYAQLKRVLAEDAALRQRATRFGAHGAPESGAPSHTPGDTTDEPRLQVSKQAALIVTGTRSDAGLEHVLEVLNLHEDDTITGELREVVDAARERIEQTGVVEPHYQRVKAAQDLAQLRQLAADPELPASARQAARRELEALPGQGAPRQVRTRAKAALERAAAARAAARAGTAPQRQPPATIVRYGPRALTTMIIDLDYWWLHYDPAEIGTALSVAQWEQFSDWVRSGADFHQSAASHRPESH